LQSQSEPDHLLNAWALAVANPIGVLRMVDTPKKIDASGLAGGLIAASLLKKLVETDILTLDAAQEVLEAALKAIGPDMATPHGHAAAEVIASLLSGPYSKYT
jgi:hypothetical protein